MKNRFIKISGAVILLLALILIYQAAVTQTATHAPVGEKETSPAPTDTTGLGEPTNDDPWDELDNLVKAYYVKTGILYQGTIKVIDGNGDSDKVMEQEKFEYAYFNNEYSYKLPPLEVVSKRNYTVIVNDDDKVIGVSPKLTAKKKPKNIFNLADFKNLFVRQNARIRVTQLGDEKILTVDSIQDPQIQGYSIYYSPKSYAIHKMLVGMLRLAPLDDESLSMSIEDSTSGNAINSYVYYLEINYSVAKPLSLDAGDFNPESKFVTIEGKKIELTPEFKDFKLFNSDQQQQ